MWLVGSGFRSAKADEAMEEEGWVLTAVNALYSLAGEAPTGMSTTAMSSRRQVVPLNRIEHALGLMLIMFQG